MKFQNNNQPDPKRRAALKALGLGAAVGAGALASSGGTLTAEQRQKHHGEETFEDHWHSFFQQHYQRMSEEEIEVVLERLERKYKAIYGVEVKVENEQPLEGVVFGYALNISKCKGYRECVKGCTTENNQSKDPDLEYIRVLELEKGTMNLETADHYYGDGETKVPQPGKFYLPVQCHHCENPPCVKACPVKATWKEPDGIVVVDYNWCIGCRMCANACPYWARKFNWHEPKLPVEQVNPETHYLGNRPRFQGVMEKCTFCIQRTRNGQMPACQEACPTGARVFGNLLDPDSEIRYVLENKNVFRLKEELNTEPKFWYYSD
ncbi:MAG: 4Fe-4S dicluster domain-containing protein [bacterium]|nr:4Fe-4S dicluster domain-containing protein [bacterium]